MPETTSTPTVQLLGLSGSLRQGSYCTALLRTLATELPATSRLHIHGFADLPLYNQDQDGDAAPAPVRELKAAIAASDGVVVVSPEYNYGMSGVMKNALDWASRPAYRSVLKGKPVIVMTVSPGTGGGMRAQGQLRQTLAGTLARLVPYPEIAVANAADRFKDGRLVEPVSLRVALDGVAALAAEIAGLRSLGAASSGT